MFEIKDHVGDVKIFVENKTLEGLFEDIAESFGKIVFATKKNAKELYQVKLKTKDIKILIHDYIEELINVAFYEDLFFEPIGVYITIKENNNGEKEFFLLSNLTTTKAFGKDYNLEVKACSFNIFYSFDTNQKKHFAEFVLDL